MFRRRTLHPGVVAVIVLLLVSVTGCADDEDDADDAEELRPISVPATAVIEFPRDIEERQIVIEGGEFDEDSITSIAEEPVILTFVNRDDEAYTFEVADVITEEEIPAATETMVEFNIPTEGNYEGQLLGPDGEEIDAMFFEVTGPGGF